MLARLQDSSLDPWNREQPLKLPGMTEKLRKACRNRAITRIVQPVVLYLKADGLLVLKNKVRFDLALAFVSLAAKTNAHLSPGARYAYAHKLAPFIAHHPEQGYSVKIEAHRAEKGVFTPQSPRIMQQSDVVGRTR